MSTETPITDAAEFNELEWDARRIEAGFRGIHLDSDDPQPPNGWETSRSLERRNSELTAELEDLRQFKKEVDNEGVVPATRVLDKERQVSELTAEASGLRMALAIANKSADDQMFQKREAESKVSELTARIAKLEKERDALDRDYQMEKAIVSRIWRMFGNPTYAELNGRSIYDLIAEARKDSARLLSELNIAHNALDLAAQRFDTMDQPGFRDDCMHAILPPTTPLPETKGQL